MSLRAKLSLLEIPQEPQTCRHQDGRFGSALPSTSYSWLSGLRTSDQRLDGGPFYRKPVRCCSPALNHRARLRLQPPGPSRLLYEMVGEGPDPGPSHVGERCSPGHSALGPFCT